MNCSLGCTSTPRVHQHVTRTPTVTEKPMIVLADLLNELKEIVTSDDDRQFLDEVDAILTKPSKADALG